MPQNSLGVISVVVDISGFLDYAFSPQDDWVAITKIGPGGTNLALPAGASSGDNYGFFDADGSCSKTSPIVVAAADSKPVNGQTAGLKFIQPFASARAVFSEKAGGWTIAVGVPPIDNAMELARAWGDNASQVNLTTTSPRIIASATVTPLVTGKLRVTVTGTVFVGSDVSAQLSLSLGSSATPAIYTQGPQLLEHNTSGALALTVDLDKIPSPPSTPVGTAVTINAVLQMSVAGGDVPAHGLEIEVQEVA
jgi:hypothetical protein